MYIYIYIYIYIHTCIYTIKRTNNNDTNYNELRANSNELIVTILIIMN